MQLKKLTSVALVLIRYVTFHGMDAGDHPVMLARAPLSDHAGSISLKVQCYVLCAEGAPCFVWEARAETSIELNTSFHILAAGVSQVLVLLRPFGDAPLACSTISSTSRPRVLFCLVVESIAAGAPPQLRSN